MKKYLFGPIWKHYIALCIGMVVIAAFGIASLVGLSSCSQSLEEALYGYVEEYKYPDIFITTEPTSSQLKEALRWVDGVSVVNTRVCAETVLRTESDKFLSIAVRSHAKDDFYKFYSWESCSESAEYDNIWLEYNFAHDNDLHLGDILEVRVEDEYRSFYVNAIVSCPETLTMEKPGTWGVDPTYGVVYFPEKLLNGTDAEGICNQFMLRTKDGYEDEAVLSDVRKTLEDYDVTIIEDTVYEESVVNTRIHDNVDPLWNMCVVIPGFFYAVALCVLFLCIAILIRQCRKNIGILRALGFDVKEIRSIFTAIALRISLLGALLGIPLGYLIMFVCADYYRNFFPIPALPCGFNWLSVAVAVALNLIIAYLAAYASSRIITSFRPVEAMSRELPGKNEMPRVIRILLKPFPPMFKFSLTTMIRNQKRFWFTVFCIACTAMLFFVSISYDASLKAIVSDIFEKRIHYDCMFCMNDQPGPQFMAKLSQQDFVSDPEIMYVYSGELSFNGITRDISVNAIDPETKMITLTDIKIPEEGIVLEHYYANLLGAKVGDTVTFMGVPMEVKAISTQYSCRIQYISMKQAKALDVPEIGTVICNTNDQTALVNYLMDCDGYLSSSFSDDMHQGVSELYESFTFVITMLLICSIIIGIVIVLTTTKTNMIERQRELCVLRTQGFTVGAISRSWLIQSLLQLILASSIGLPGGIGLSKITLKTLETYTRTYPYASGTSQIIMTVALVASYMLISHILAMGSIRRWNLADTVKSGD